MPSAIRFSSVAARRFVLAPLAGAATWLLVLLTRLWSVDESWWIARDDAVISLSHAKNAARFGTIGVSPGGDRVEGFSSPLHFASAYILQLRSDLGYRTLTIVLLVVAVAATGAFVTSALRSTAVRLEWSATGADIVAVGLSLAVAMTVAASWTATGWIGSGMENPLIVLWGIGAVSAVLLLPGHRAAQPILIVALSLFSISRVEFAAFVIPLIVTTAGMHAASFEAGRRWRSFAWTVGIPLLFIALVHVARRLYFGEWLPNTAVVQSRESGVDQFAFLVLLVAFLLAFLARSVVMASQRDAATRSLLASGASTILAFTAGGLVWMMVTGRTEGSLIDLALLPPLIPLAVVVVVLGQAVRAFDDRPWLVNTAFVALVSVPLAQYIVLGPARLDQYRVAATVVPFLAMWAAVLALRLQRILDAAEWPTVVRRRQAEFVVWAVIASIALAGVGWTAYKDQPRRLNHEITGAQSIVAVAHDTRDRHLAGLGLPIIANPDLGKVSFDKSAVMVDLGLLGDPLLTLLDRDRPDLVDEYLAEVASPDIVESHSGWSCQYAGWLDSPVFEESYQLSDDRWLDGRVQAEGCPLDGRWTIWVRTDADGEYALTRELLVETDPAQRIAEQIGICSASGSEAFRCERVRRSIQRAAAQLRASGEFSSVVDALRESPTVSLDVELLERGPGWARRAFEEFADLLEPRN